VEGKESRPVAVIPVPHGEYLQRPQDETEQGDR